MLKRGVASLCVLAMVSVANADMLIDLVPVPAQPVGGYAPGAMIDVEVYLEQISGTAAIRLRTVQLDFTLTDDPVQLTSFDFNDGFVDPLGFGFFSTQETLPIPGGSYTGTASSPAQPTLPATGPVLLGTLMVTLPNAPGVYEIEAISRADDPANDNRGGVIIYGFGTTPDPRVELRPGDGLVGDSLFVQVIPEPATLAFLGLGGLALLRRRH